MPSIASQPAGPMPRRRNPLKRRSDSLREWLLLAFALGLGVAAALSVLLGLHLYAADRASAAQQARTLHQVTAVAATQPFSAGVGARIATLDWTDATGKHAAEAPVPNATELGDPVVIWVNRNDIPHGAPIAAAQSAGNAVAYGVAVFAGSAALLAGGQAWARHALNKRADRSWEQEWALFEPKWNRWNRRG